jgi:hypothetical protein
LQQVDQQQSQEVRLLLIQLILYLTHQQLRLLHLIHLQ